MTPLSMSMRTWRGRSACLDFDDVALELIDTYAFDAGALFSAAPNALTDRAIPRSFVSVDIDGGGLPKIEFSNMCAGPVVA